MDFTISVISGTAGAMLGNIVWYLAARALGHDRLRPFIQRHGKWLTMNWKDVERVHHWFDDHGIALVMLGRLVPTIRSIISIPAGLLDMRFRNFVIASTIGTAVWTAILTGAGYKLQENFHEIGKVIGPLSNFVLIALVGVYVWRLFTHKVD
jgi:membrane protein DedA with SNARE-associated domain